jgi:hypothetical protein
MHPEQCPFSQPDFEQIRQELLDMPLQKLIFATEEIMDQLTPVEMINYRISKFVSEFSDKHGRIEWIRKLIDDGMIVSLQFPHDFAKNPRMVNMMQLPEYRMQFPFGNTDALKDAAALTDDLVVMNEPVTVKNPRWEHKDEKKKESSPDTVLFGDTIVLMADVTGIPSGASVSFDIYDISVSPPMVVESARGKNEMGVAKGEWVVSDKSGKGIDAKCAFETVVKSKVSEKCEIKVDTKTLCSIMLCFDVDPNDSAVQDDEFILKGSDSTQPYYQKLTVRDDKIIGNKTLELNFVDVNPLWSYTLEINPGAEGSTYTLFENMPYKTISSLRFGA